MRGTKPGRRRSSGSATTRGSSRSSVADFKPPSPPRCSQLRRNWLHLGGDGGLTPTAVLSIAASVKRHGINPWCYLTHAISELPDRSVGADLADLLPDAWAKCHGETWQRVGSQRPPVTSSPAAAGRPAPPGSPGRRAGGG